MSIRPYPACFRFSPAVAAAARSLYGFFVKGGIK